MKRIISIFVFGFLVLVAIFLLLKMREIPNPDEWTSHTRRYYNPITGMIRIVDSDSGETLFFHSDDPLVYPESIEKSGNGEWRVKLKKRN